MRYLFVSLFILIFSKSIFAQIPIHESIPSELQGNIRKGLELVTSMKWSKQSNSHLEFFGPSNGGEIYLKFLEPVAGVFFDSDESNGFFAYAEPGYNVVYFTSLINDPDVPPLELVYALMHEVHHFGELLISHRHVACPSVDVMGEPLVHPTLGHSYEGKFACDDYPDGAFGLGVIMMGQIVKYCENCSQETVERARLLGQKLLRRIISPSDFLRYQEEYSF